MKINKILLSTILFYIIFPIIIFLFGWTKIFVSIPLSIIFCYFGYKIVKEESFKINLFKDNKIYWVITIIVLFLWVWLSGIGKFNYQNSDFFVRNPIYSDLINRSWPVKYDNDSYFMYYFTFWLFPSLLSKIFNLNAFMQNVILFLWALIGIFFVVYLMNKQSKKCSILNPLLLIGFSGLDIIPYFFLNNNFDFTKHIEWHSFIMQYSSNTTQLYWVFNQCIVGWIIIILFLQIDSRYSLAIISFSFAYSPYITLGLVPFALYKAIKNKTVFNVLNITIPMCMAIVFGLFYASKHTTSVEFLLNTFGMQYLILYMFFIVFEFVLYYISLSKQVFKNKYLLIGFIELLIIPLIYSKDGNISMRCSIPALFILMLYIIDCFRNKTFNRTLIILLIIGAITPICEISRSIEARINNNIVIQNQIETFNEMENVDETYSSIVENQFFVYDYNNKIFYKTIGKK